MLVQSASRGPVPVTLSTGLCIPSRTEVLLYAKLPQSCKDELGIVMPAQSTQLSQCVLSAYSVSQAEGRQIPIRLMNTANFDIELQAGQKVSEFCPVVESPAAKSESTPYSVNANLL